MNLQKKRLEKLKTQIAPGFERRKLNENVKSRLFFKQSSDFYKSKGTDEGFKILFKALYGKDVEVIRPSQFVFEASASSNRKTRDLVLYISDQKTDYTDIILHRTLKQNEKDSTVTDGEDVTAYGTITNVERIERGSVFYYLVSLDSDYDKDISVSGTVFGTFVSTSEDEHGQNTTLTAHPDKLDQQKNWWLPQNINKCVE